ncbi:MAG: ABC transporter substrate-binding protein [Chloroflexota bacterium]
MKAKILGILFVLLLVGVLLPACTQQAAPSPTAAARTVVLVNVSDLTGPTISIQAPIARGFEDYLNYYVNKVKGGIKGKNGTVMVRGVAIDTAYDVTKAKEAWARMKGEGMIAANSYMGGITGGLQADFERDKIPMLAGSSDIVAAWSEWVFSMGNSGHPSETTGWLNGLMKLYKQKGVPLTTVGWTGGDAPYQPSFMVGVDEWAAQYGIKVVKELYPAGSTDITEVVARLKRTGVQEVYHTCPARDAVVFLRDWKKAGMDPGITTMAICQSSTDIAALGGKDLIEGVKFENWWMQLDKDPKTPDPAGFKIARDIWKELRPKDTLTDLNVAGMCWAMTLEEAVRLALDNVTPDKLTGETLREHGFGRMKDWTANGLIAPTTYGDQTKMPWEPGPPYTYRIMKGGILTDVVTAEQSMMFPPGKKDELVKKYNIKLQ